MSTITFGAKTPNPSAIQMTAESIVPLVWAQFKAWGFCHGVGASIAAKTFVTEVGPKTMAAYLRPSRDGHQLAVLTGEYQSLGRNVLEPLSLLIPKTATAASVSSQVAVFIKTAETIIEGSYARRLIFTSRLKAMGGNDRYVVIRRCVAGQVQYLGRVSSMADFNDYLDCCGFDKREIECWDQQGDGA